MLALCHLLSTLPCGCHCCKPLCKAHHHGYLSTSAWWFYTCPTSVGHQFGQFLCSACHRSSTALMRSCRTKQSASTVCSYFLYTFKCSIIACMLNIVSKNISLEFHWEIRTFAACDWTKKEHRLRFRKDWKLVLTGVPGCEEDSVKRCVVVFHCTWLWSTLHFTTIVQIRTWTFNNKNIAYSLAGFTCYKNIASLGPPNWCSSAYNFTVIQLCQLSKWWSCTGLSWTVPTHAVPRMYHMTYYLFCTSFHLAFGQ